VTGLGLGCAPIGNLFTGVSDGDARATIDAAFEAGICYFDTAPLYGHGLSERRLGEALADRPRDAYVLSTKVGRLLRPQPAAGPTPPTIFAGVDDLVPHFDFSRDGVLISIEESLARLGADRLDVVLLHDPDDHEDDAVRHAFPTLLELRDAGVVGAVGCGMNQVAMLERFVERVDLDCVLLAGRYSLLDHTGAERLLPACAERGVGVVLGGVFNSGVLVDPDDRPSYDYAPAPTEVVARARRLRDRCSSSGVALPAAALQFVLRHPAVTTVLVGARSGEEVTADVGYASAEIEEALWSTLEAAS
jgi:D-threo-aldose 1-dehydrogenase